MKTAGPTNAHIKPLSTDNQQLERRKKEHFLSTNGKVKYPFNKQNEKKRNYWHLTPTCMCCMLEEANPVKEKAVEYI